MELVYLWVEDYKNIKRQGFNFSPRFKCEFDGENLTIEEKYDYVSIFPDNINITAIVGENGSGKSSILTIMTMFQFIQKDISFNETKIIIVFKKGPDTFFYSNINLLTKLKKGILNPIVCNYFIEQMYYTSHTVFPKTGYELSLNKDTIVQRSILNTFDEKNIKLTSFMYLADKATIHHKIDKTFEQVININTTKNKHDINELLKIQNKYHRFLILEYIKLDFIQKNLFIHSNFNKVESCHADNINNFNLLKDKLALKKHLFDNKLDVTENEFYRYTFQFKAFKINKLTKKEKIFYTKYIEYYNFDLIDCKGRNYNVLSYGEKKIYGILLNIYYFIKTVIEKKIFILDEPDMGLHPQWQKQFIQELINLLKCFDQKNQFIITTHSPFLISDLPKENIIFLDKVDDISKKKYPQIDFTKLKEGNCINISKYIGMKTFGANIHTLLSDGFFMRDGLMGEFAKGKIEEIKKFYEEVKEGKTSKEELQEKYVKNIKKFRHIESIIGEPFLQTIIKNYLDELEQIFDTENYKLRQRERLLKEFSQEELQEHLNKLKKTN